MIRKRKPRNPEIEWLVAGLGNPGPEYRKTRHNIGFWVVDRLAALCGVTLEELSHRAVWGTGLMAGKSALLVCPQTFMNVSGECLKHLVKAFDIDRARVIIVHDDLDLPLGRVRVGFGASSGGHRGVESVIAAFGSADFFRVRIGVGRPPAGSPKEEITEYVLSPFASDEREAASRAVEEGSRAVVELVEKEMERSR